MPVQRMKNAIVQSVLVRKPNGDGIWASYPTPTNGTSSVRNVSNFPRVTFHCNHTPL